MYRHSGSVQALRPIGGVEIKVKCTVVQALGLCTGCTARRGLEVNVKVKCTVLQALRLCTGSTARMGSRGKGKVQRCTGTEALYRPYGP